MELRDYQWEVIEPALEGKNIIIWLPTGAGKTRAAAYVCKRHLESHGKSKVAVLVNTVPLVDQHLKNEFSFLQNRFNVKAISGESVQKMIFSDIVKNNDLIICTAKILQNAMNSQDEEMHVELTDFSLLVIDECHHTHKETTYNQIMKDYLERKLKGQQNLPQILGLTASLGTGGANSLVGAQDHILQICANLDTEKIMSSDKHKFYLDTRIPQPKKQYDLSDPRLRDPFGQKLKKIMTEIYTYLEVPNLTTNFGSQIFEQQIVEIEKEGAKEFCQKTRVCALHLRKYNDALLINDTVRMIDAFNTLDEFYEMENAVKVLQHPAERYLVGIFGRNRAELLALAEDRRNENPNLEKLQQVLQEQFQELKESRGIIFTRTRQSAHSLHQWVKDNQALCELGIKAAVLTGAGYSNQTKHMTQIAKLQHETVVIHKVRDAGREQLRQLHNPDHVRLYCINCNVAVCYGSDLCKIEKMHHVNINPNFRFYYKKSPNHVLVPRQFKDWKPGSSISCNACGQAWGMEMIYQQSTLPMLSIKNFVVETPDGRRIFKQWSKVTFDIKEFDYTEFFRNNNLLDTQDSEN
ncbi:probable ATP-dependent RNA helicase DHX58 isoform X2 [Sceloporus undulatus]|uniref:probable ATP-dependent RNA helicase DHX58 isoform X2 n=1 Tax=Sceloporus undulatus TaxID=8520 RepID=UPI001C4CC430|nr:probable ATP-dependent RNA helicase DHX58 isoform X2 [Sceloporus undulatus]